MNEQIKKLKVGQKVWVDNLEKDRLEKWIIKSVTINSVTVENKKSKEVFRFYEKGGQFLLKKQGNKPCKSCAIYKAKNGEKGEKKETVHLYKRMALFRRINDRHTYFGVDAVGNSIFVFDSALYFDSHGCEILFQRFYFESG